MTVNYQQTRQIHRHCTVCGEAEHNPATLGLRFVCLEPGAVAASVPARAHLQGYPGLLHGGMISTLLDAAMTHCLFTLGVQALTAELNVRFLFPVSVDKGLNLTARLIGQRRGIYQLEGAIRQGGRLLARASGKFIEPKGDTHSFNGNTPSASG